MSSVIFDGHDFSTLFYVGDPSINILNSRVQYASSDNATGAVVIGRRWDTSTVSFSIGVVGSASERRNKLSTLGAWLDVDEPKELVLPDTPERYYLAIPEGALDLQRAIRAELSTITFTIVDPIAYGEEKTVTVPSGGSLTFNVGGKAATRPRIQVTAVRDSASLVWGLRLDDKDYLHVATGNAAGRIVIADCDERTLTISGNVAIPTPDSDWLEFEPGEHTLTMDKGTGAATVTWRERWY